MKKLNKGRFWLFYHAAILIISLFSAASMKYNQTGKAFIPETIVPFASIFLMSACTGYLAIFLTNRSAKLTHAQLNKWILPGLILFYLSVFIIANLSITLTVFVWYLVHGMDLAQFLPQLIQNDLKFANSRLMVWLLAFSIVFFYTLWRKSARKEQQLREEMLNFQVQTLKSQINPHFLFNTLNTLSELVYESPEQADNYVRELSKVYRYIIVNEETRLISIDEEIDFVCRYFKLQQVRDKDKISLEVNITDGIKRWIVPVSLQLLVENAIKHNSFTQKSPLVIRIHDALDYVAVSNNIQRKDTLEPATGKGLINLRKRVSLIMNKEIDIEEADTIFTVKIPVTTKGNESPHN
jgi:hypothetical protein